MGRGGGEMNERKAAILQYAGHRRAIAGLVGSLLGSIEAREGYQKQKVWWTCYVPTVFR